MTQPSVFESRTPEVIKSEILMALSASGAEIDTREGSYTNTLVSQISYALWKHSQLLAGLLPIVFPGPDSGEYLDLHAAQLGMVRQPGTKARAEVTFTGADGTVIPAGTAVYAPDSGLRYLTLKAVTIMDETTVTVVSVTEMELPVAAAVTLMEGYSTEDVANQLTAAVSVAAETVPVVGTVNITET